MLLPVLGHADTKHADTKPACSLLFAIEAFLLSTALAALTTIIPEATLPAGGWAEFDGTITMDAADVLGGDAEQNTEITITIYGDEIDVS